MKTIGKTFYIVCFLVGILPLLPARSIASEPKDSCSRVSLVGDDLSAWQGDTGDWQVAGEVFIRPDNEKLLAAKPGAGVIWNGPKGKTKHLTTKSEFGDVRAHIEFLLCEDSNSGIYFAGQYELQIFDNWQTRSFHSGIECGGIYQRWDKNKTPKGYEGHSPRVDASFPSGVWQTFDVVFRAARFDLNGRKTANAKFIKVFHNGILIHENVELNGPTRGSMFTEEKPRGPLLFQGNHGPVAFRNVWVAPIDESDFFIFGYALRDAGIATKDQGKLLRELGYDGMGHVGYEGLAGVVQELDRNGLRMFSIYVRVQLDEGKPKYSPKLKEAIEILAGRDAMLIITINSRKYKPSETAGDDKAVEIVREISDMAAANGVRVALYSHYDFWMGRFGDSVRIAEKVDRKNVGAVFSLCHWLRDGGGDMRPLLEKSIDYLFAVVIHGADHKGGRKELIQLLGNGNYDVYPLLQILKELGYSGPFGLLHYSIEGDIRETLMQAMKVWRQFIRRLTSKTKYTQRVWKFPRAKP
jgi:sugar phosphate isomerase/epimerase